MNISPFLDNSPAPSASFPESYTLPPASSTPLAPPSTPNPMNPMMNRVQWGMEGPMGGNNLPNSPWGRRDQSPNSNPVTSPATNLLGPQDSRGGFNQPSRSDRLSTASSSRSPFASPVPNTQQAKGPYSNGQYQLSAQRRRPQSGMGGFE